MAPSGPARTGRAGAGRPVLTRPARLPSSFPSVRRGVRGAAPPAGRPADQRDDPAREVLLRDTPSAPLTPLAPRRIEIEMCHPMSDPALRRLPRAPRPSRGYSDEIAALFTRADRQFLFARWGRPLAPVVFGVEDATVSTLKGAIEAVTALAGHRMTETDPELGANLMVFFIRDWAELTETPGLDRLLPDLAGIGRRGSRGRTPTSTAPSASMRMAASRRPLSSSAWMRRWPRSRPRPSRSARRCRRSFLWSDTAFCRCLAAGGPVRGWPRHPQAADRRPDPRGL
jgi:hypothetical protein